MANFKGVNGVTDLEAKVAKIIDEHFIVKNRFVDESLFLSWVEKNEVEFVCWWDYMNTKSESVVLAPFMCLRGLSCELPLKVSLAYLKLKREMALRIAILGFVSTE